MGYPVSEFWSGNMMRDKYVAYPKIARG